MLIDSFGRTIRYLRVSVTDRCNLFCNYCRLPNETLLPNNRELLDFDELVRLLRIFLQLGIERIRLTGGEPLLRRNLVGLVQEISRLPGLQELALTTNALLLERYAVALRAAGLQRVNISLDSLKPQTFDAITQRHLMRPDLFAERQEQQGLPAVLAGIAAARAAGLHPVKINMVVMRGINDTEIVDMVHYAHQHGLLLRFIETMPVGEAGLDMADHFIPAEEILEQIQRHFARQLLPIAGKQGSGPARYFRLADSSAEIGVISARSRHFCDTCNRMRLTSKGSLVYCLGRSDRMDLKQLLRSGAGDEQIKESILAAVALKPQQHEFEQKEFYRPSNRMSALGG
ncbi:GTP 3',8-cyclase MoaA [Candidatus Magnetaquicoccus inordinatus]|uniref:GTP 3',8-cyclase MoaA n=1 Tax=Candidatus Magnetaquicoccus inordinatus TaxID=2496818 RepID=UPI001D0E84EC|nr:GTP 3',8-cyclase MoaA [Candidatus Magnetaquicoccus inordinatus]